MTNDLVVLIDRLEGEHGGVLDVVALVRSAVDERDDVALKGALAAGADELGTALTVHSETEDNDLFPQLAEMIGEGLVGVFVEEHVRIRALRDQVYERMGQGEADFEGCGELCDLLTSHMERENQVLFPAARGLLAD